MKQSDLMQTDDAMVWAEEFVKTKEKNNWTLEDIDEGLMVAWFASAIMAKEDIMMRKMGGHIEVRLPTLEELEADGITVRLPTVKEQADEYLRDMMIQEKGGHHD